MLYVLHLPICLAPLFDLPVTCWITTLLVLLLYAPLVFQYLFLLIDIPFITFMPFCLGFVVTVIHLVMPLPPARTAIPPFPLPGYLDLRLDCRLLRVTTFPTLTFARYGFGSRLNCCPYLLRIVAAVALPPDPLPTRLLDYYTPDLVHHCCLSALFYCNTR